MSREEGLGQFQRSHRKGDYSAEGKLRRSTGIFFLFFSMDLQKELEEHFDSCWADKKEFEELLLLPL